MLTWTLRPSVYDNYPRVQSPEALTLLCTVVMDRQSSIAGQTCMGVGLALYPLCGM